MALAKNLSRLVHRVKITAGQLVRPILDFAYKNRIGSASRLCQAFPSELAPAGCSSIALFEHSPIPFREPKYYFPGPIEESYLQRFRISGRDGEKSSATAGVISLRNASVSLPTGMLLWEGKIFDEAFPNPVLLTNPKYLAALELIPFKEKQRIKEPAVLLTMPWHQNYYHWIVDIMPRLLLYEQNKDINNFRLVLHNPVPDFIKESLDLVGYSDKILFLDNGVYQFDQLHLLTRLSPPEIPSPIGMKWLNKKLKKSGGSRKKRRIYVSRSDAKYRFVTNELEVQDILAEYGFETFVLSEYTLEEKIKIFQEAEIVLGSSGAGFIGTTFMEPGSILIEFFPEKHFADCFYYMAVIGEIEYGFLIGKQDGLGFSVDPTQLRSIMERVSSNLLG